jgi:hypothetical protein
MIKKRLYDNQKSHQKTDTHHGQLEKPRLPCHGQSYGAHASHTQPESHLQHVGTMIEPSWDMIQDHLQLLGDSPH